MAKTRSTKPVLKQAPFAPGDVVHVEGHGDQEFLLITGPSRRKTYATYNGIDGYAGSLMESQLTFIRHRKLAGVEAKLASVYAKGWTAQ